MPSASFSLPATRRWAAAGLIVLLLLIGTYDEQMFTFLTSAWQKLLAIIGLDRQATALQSGINGGITKRFLPAVATYAALYLAICLLLLRVLFPARGQWHLVLQVYAGIAAAYIGLVLMAGVAGNIPWAYLLSRQILDFMVSPLPVVGLCVLLRAGFGPRLSS